MGCCLSSAGAYPGNTRIAKPTYQPSDSEYKQVTKSTAVANVHFITCEGGNALKLVGKPNRGVSEGGDGNNVGDGLAKYISGESLLKEIWIVGFLHHIIIIILIFDLRARCISRLYRRDNDMNFMHAHIYIINAHLSHPNSVHCTVYYT